MKEALAHRGLLAVECSFAYNSCRAAVTFYSLQCRSERKTEGEIYNLDGDSVLYMVAKE